LLSFAEMAIKTFTVSALTSGVLVLAYAAWSKWRPTPKLARSSLAAALPVDAQTLSEATAAPVVSRAPASEPDSIDVVLDELWGSDEASPNPNEQLVDFSTEPEDAEDETCVAPEGLGVRWLTRATEAMSPFHHALSVRDEAEAALLEGVTQNIDAEADAAPESSQRSKDGDFDVEFPAEKRGG
jgi:hypothetical protein